MQKTWDCLLEFPWFAPRHQRSTRCPATGRYRQAPMRLSLTAIAFIGPLGAAIGLRPGRLRRQPPRVLPLLLKTSGPWSTGPEKKAARERYRPLFAGWLVLRSAQKH